MCYVSRIICGGKEWSILLRIYCEVTLDLLTLRFQFPGASRKKYRLQELGSNFLPSVLDNEFLPYMDYIAKYGENCVEYSSRKD